MKAFFSPLLLLCAATALSACKAVVLHPAGDIAVQQRDLLVVSFLLMLLIIIPVMALVVWFAWKYRATNTQAEYDPEWDHSTKLELMIWAAPLLIIIVLGAVTWMGTHLLDPYRPLNRISANEAVSQDVRPLEVNVVALDWKWLFIYPEQGVASVNQLVVPTNRPLQFRITASSVMNSFYIPALAGQIYAMPGMETKLHAVANRDGVYEGFSANYSGHGFSHMRFAFYSTSDAQFQQWVDKVKSGGGALNRADYLKLVQPTENEPVRTFASVENGLYPAILNMCVAEGKMCMGDMMAIDARGGLGLAGIKNTAHLTYDKYGLNATPSAFAKAYVASLCATGQELQTAGAFSSEKIDMTPLSGAGLVQPRLNIWPAQPVLSQPTTVAPVALR